MKKILFIAILFPLVSFAQYFPLVKNNAIWREMVTQYDGNTFFHYRIQYVMMGDTLIDNLSYKKLFTSNYDSVLTNLVYQGAMREDTQKKVYFYEKTDTIESLLYDFGLGVGDTLFVENWQDSIQEVVSIDSILIGNQWRKRWVFNPTGMSMRVWIEGIGDTKGLFFPALFEFENYNILCCYQDINEFWTNPSVVQSGLNCFNVGMEEFEKYKAFDVKVYPNPANEFIVFEFSTFAELETKVSIFNSFGQEVKSLIKSDKNVALNISVGEFPLGLYYYSIVNSNSEILKTGKFIIE